MNRFSVGSYLPLIRVIVLCWLVAGLNSAVMAAVILQYHHIEDGPGSTTLSLQRFEAHLEYLSDHNFRVIALPELVDLFKRGAAIPDKTAVITFDDAYASVYHHAYPKLREMGWPFTVFVATDAVDQGYKGVLSWQQLREMSRHGATIGNHTRSHVHMIRRKPGESQHQWQQRIKAQVLEAQERIESEVGHTHRLLAYPYGEYNIAVVRLVKQLGFWGFGQQSGPLDESGHSQLIPRFPFAGNYGSLADFAVKVQTLPLPVKQVARVDTESLSAIVNPLLNGHISKPELTMMLPLELAQKLSCYGTGQGRIAAVIDNNKETAANRETPGATNGATTGGTTGNTVKVTVGAKQALPVGRSRYNCTAPGPDGRFYWYSQMFIRPRADGSWYKE